MERIGGITMNPYEVLGVDRKADDKTIKREYRRLARKWHPDLYKSKEDQETAAEKMKEINDAYEILSDKTKRATYDMQNPVSANVYEYYAQKQTKPRHWYRRNRSSSEIEKEKQRKAVLQFLEVEYEHKSNILDMFAELANGAVSGEFTDEEYSESLALLCEESNDCISKIQQIITAAKERQIQGLEATFKQAQETIKELTQKCNETPNTLKKAQYAEETRRLAEKIYDLISGFGPRINSITNFNLLDKTWEFHNDNELNSACEEHKKEVREFLADIQWIQKTATERNIAIGEIEGDRGEKFTLAECQKMLQKSAKILDLNLQGLRQEFWEKKCRYEKNRSGEVILADIGLSYEASSYKGDFICPPKVKDIASYALDWAEQLSSLTIPAYVVKKDHAIKLPSEGKLKTIIFTFGPCSQIVDVSRIDAEEISLEGDYILIGNKKRSSSGFALVDAQNVYVYDEKKLCKLNGVTSIEQLEKQSQWWSSYSGWEGHKVQIHTWAQAVGKLPNPNLMRLIPVTTQAVKEWDAIDKTNFESVLSNTDEELKTRVIRLYIALGALKGSYCHAQAEYLISKLDVSTMYRSRLERFPQEKRLNQDPMFYVPKTIVDMVEENIENQEFLPYVFAFLEGYELFQAEARKANVKLSTEFIIEKAAQCIFHSKVRKEGVVFAKQLLDKERDVDEKIADRIMKLYSIAQKQAESGANKNIIQTIDMASDGVMHYRFFNLNSLETYLTFSESFMIKVRYSRTTTYYGVEAENVFLSNNSHAIEIIDGEDNRVAIAILNLFDKGELFADIMSCENKSIDVLEAVRRAVVDQKKCNHAVTGISIGMNEAPRVTKYNKWREVVKNASVAWTQEVRWIKFEYLFKSRILGTSYKGYRVRFMVDGEAQYLDSPNPWDDPRMSRRRNRRRGWW